jgi:hypothetical protein
MEEFTEDSNAVKLVYRDGEWKEEVIFFRVSVKSFAQGAMRSAHVAFINKSDVKFVAKRFLTSTDEDEQKYREDVIVQSVASSIAEAYNQYGPPKPVWRFV